jgi:hypothetical protein
MLSFPSSPAMATFFTVDFIPTPALASYSSFSAKLMALDMQTINSSLQSSGTMFDYSATALTSAVPNSPIQSSFLPGPLLEGTSQQSAGSNLSTFLSVYDFEFRNTKSSAKALADFLSPPNSDAPTRPPGLINDPVRNQTLAGSTAAASSPADAQLVAVNACSTGTQTACDSALRLLVAAIREANLTAPSLAFSTAVLSSFRQVLASVRASNGPAGDLAITVATIDDVFAQMVPERNEAVSSSPA